MHIIPVIDILDGKVVHARAGQRALYRPVASGLTPSTEPASIIDAFLSLCPFKTLYMADLNAITSGEAQRALLFSLIEQFPELVIWLDAGRFTVELCEGSGDNLVPVFGSEWANSPEKFLAAMHGFRDPVLSLDFQKDRFLGYKGLLQDPAQWPERIILMRLDRVGTDRGPETDVCDWTRHYPEKKFYLAGGVRDINDIHKAGKAGAAGVLLATALHEKRISGDELAEIITSIDKPANVKQKLLQGHN